MYPHCTLSEREAARFWSKVDIAGPDDCWLWTASTDTNGYGLFWLNGTMPRAHRVAYEACVGPIPDGLQLHHRCRTKHCINPTHLQVVTPLEHTHLGNNAGAQNAAKTHCPKGHPYDEANTLLHQGSRFCLACKRRYEQERYSRSKERFLEKQRQYRAKHRDRLLEYRRQYYRQRKTQT